MIGTVQEKEYYSEVYAVLMYLGANYTKRIPQKLMEVIEKTRDKDSNFKLDKDKKLYEQNIRQETKDFIAALNLLYWEKSQDRKAKLLQHYKKNDIIYEKAQQEKYSYENLFKNNKKQEEPNDVEEIANENANMQLIESKESFIQKIINKIKEIFWRFRK